LIAFLATMTSSTNRHLPILVERSVAEARVARTSLADTFKAGLPLDEVMCRKGCNNCCYLPVYITLLEGITIYQWLREQGFWAHSFKTKVQEVAKRTHGLSPEVWGMSLIPCPLLSQDGLCKAYEVRPFSCAVTFSTGDPANCHPHNLGPGLLPRRELFEQLTEIEAPILKRHHLQHFRLPLAVALLYGEKIAEGDLDLDDSQKAIWEAP
jgi:Fe-S-cluster containining protein